MVAPQPEQSPGPVCILRSRYHDSPPTLPSNSAVNSLAAARLSAPAVTAVLPYRSIKPRPAAWHCFFRQLVPRRQAAGRQTPLDRQSHRPDAPARMSEPSAELGFADRSACEIRGPNIREPRPALNPHAHLQSSGHFLFGSRRHFKLRVAHVLDLDLGRAIDFPVVAVEAHGALDRILILRNQTVFDPNLE